jgi:FMN-dependent NADH-azoreductase
VIYTSAVYGPERPPAFGSDFQRPYLTDWLHWAGVEDVTDIVFRPNLVTSRAEAARAEAVSRAREAAARSLVPSAP